MSENTKIKWCDHTFNPWVGCTKISPACDHCYAEGWAKRSGQVVWGGERKRTSIANWRMPIKWNREAEASGARPKVFCASLADVFDNEVDPQWREDLFRLIEATPSLDWLLLTKRIGNVYGMVPLKWIGSSLRGRGGAVVHQAGWPENVWLGATICNQEEANRDIPKLLAVPAHKRFLSIEPLLGPVDLSNWFAANDLHEIDGGPRLDWVIVGGESGPNARSMLPHWATSLRDQCQTAGVPFLFKQWGEWAPEGDNAMRRVGKKAAGRLLDGREWNGVPA